ncbi:MAG: ATP:cob(I)alamin adenosyltransferase [Fervidicoccaceae archaeon]
MKPGAGRGDSGHTECPATGELVSKSHACLELLGSLDEAESALGLARALAPQGLEDLASVLEELQLMLFRVGYTVAGRIEIDERDLERLNSLLELYWPREQRGFLIHGAGAFSSAIGLARALVRRAERALVAALEAGVPLRRSDLALSVLNRMSDVLFGLEVRAASFERAHRGSSLSS